MADDLDPEGEYAELDDVEDTADGGAIVRLDDSPKRGNSQFFDNLAEDLLSERELDALAVDLLDLIERDKEAREKRDKQYEEGIRRTGLGDDAPGGASFQGASRVVHPVLTEVCVDFQSRAMKELWPADGPAKSKIVGTPTDELVEKASRKADFMNWQLTVQATEARSEVEQLLTQLPLGGGQYLKITWDEKRNRPRFLFVPIDDMLLPYAATSFQTAQRKTHRQYLTRLTYEQRVKTGMYRDADVISPSMTPETSRAEEANDKVEGRESTAYNEDGLRTVFECYVIMEITGDDQTDVPAPYIVSIDKTSNKVLSVYRNWDEEDDSQEELEWIVEFPFVPWRGAYPIGMVHMIGGLSGAATGALRALLDAAHIANSQTGLKLKGGTRGGQSITLQTGEVEEIEGGLNVDDVRKLYMPLPYNQPSGTLFSLLGFLVDAAKGVVQTTFDTADSNENVPVGTTLARIEQASTVFSAIHGRMHDAMGRVLRVLHRLNRDYLDDAEEKAESGSVIASRADFNGPMDVVPVSDPNIFSEAQRFAQVQAVAQRAQLRPDLYDGREVEMLIGKTLKLPNFAKLLIPKQSPTEENAVSENVKATLGRPIVAFPDQDHIAHLKTHLAYMQSPVLGSSQLMAPSLLPLMLGHLKEHIALWYAAETFEQANEVTDHTLSDMIGQTHDKRSRQALDQLIAEASLDVVASAAEALGALPPVIAQAIQMAQALAPPMPQDPAAMVAMEDVKMRGKLGEQKEQTAQAKLEQEARQAEQEAQAEQQRIAQEAQADRERIAQEAAAEAQAQGRADAIERERIAAEDRRSALEAASREAMNTEDNDTQLEIAEMRDSQPNPNPKP